MIKLFSMIAGLIVSLTILYLVLVSSVPESDNKIKIKISTKKIEILNYYCIDGFEYIHVNDGFHNSHIVTHFNKGTGLPITCKD